MFPMRQASNPLEMGPNLPARCAGMHSLPSSRKQRTVFSPSQLSLLEKWFFDNPFPKGEQRQLMAVQLGISVQHIQVWFQNKRAKEKRKMKKVADLKNKKFIPEPPAGWPKDLPFNTNITDALKSTSQCQLRSTYESSSPVHTTSPSNCATSNSVVITTTPEAHDISELQTLENIMSSSSEEAIESRGAEAYMSVVQASEYNSGVLSAADEVIPNSTYTDPLSDSWNLYGNYLEPTGSLAGVPQTPYFPVEQYFGESSTSCLLQEPLYAHQQAASSCMYQNHLPGIQENQCAYYDGCVMSGSDSWYSSLNCQPSPYFDSTIVDPSMESSHCSGSSHMTIVQPKRGKKGHSAISISSADTMGFK